MKIIKYPSTENIIVGLIGDKGGIMLISPFTSILHDLKPSTVFDVEGELITLTKLKKLINEHTRKGS